MRILEAILAGERDPAVLATLCSTRIKASRQTVAKSLHGNWREELLFSLRVALDSYRFAQSKIAVRTKSSRIIFCGHTSHFGCWPIRPLV